MNSCCFLTTTEGRSTSGAIYPERKNKRINVNPVIKKILPGLYFVFSFSESIQAINAGTSGRIKKFRNARIRIKPKMINPVL
jgi:hypothetical protein